MARQLEGRLEARPLANGEVSWVGRVAGRKQTLGRTPDVNEAEAQRELAYMVEQVRRDVWKPKKRNAPPLPEKPTPEPDLRALATDFLASQKKAGMGDAQHADLKGLLTFYVLRHLRRPDGSWPTPSQLSVEEAEGLRTKLQDERERLDALRAAGYRRLRNGRPVTPGEAHQAGDEPLPQGLGPRRINRAMNTLYRVLDWAASRHKTPSARDLRDAKLMLKVDSGELPHLNCGQVQCLLEAAAEQERTADRRNRHVARVAPLAVLALAGLRLQEMCNLNVMDVRTSGERWTINVRKAKTAAGQREVPVVGYLHLILEAHLARRRDEGARPRDPLFATRTGGRIGADNFRNREFTRAIAAADLLCVERGVDPIPGIGEDADENESRATPHSLRRAYITHQAELGTRPKRLMKWVGHRDAKLTIETYERVEDRDGEDPLLKLLYGDELPAVELVVLPAAGTPSA